MAVSSARQHALALQAFPQLLGDGLRLPRVSARADDEIIGVAHDVAHVEDHYVVRQLLVGDGRNPVCELE
jgi:hypothetical protein